MFSRKFFLSIIDKAHADTLDRPLPPAPFNCSTFQHHTNPFVFVPPLSYLGALDQVALSPSGSCPQRPVTTGHSGKLMWNHQFNDGQPIQDQCHDNFVRRDTLKRPYSAPSEDNLTRVYKKMRSDEEASSRDSGDWAHRNLAQEFDPSILKEHPENGAEQINKSKYFHQALGKGKETQQSSAGKSKDPSDMAVPEVAEIPANDGIYACRPSQRGFNSWFRYMPSGHMVTNDNTIPDGPNDSGSISKAVIAGRSSFDTRAPVVRSTTNSHIAIPTSDDSCTTNGSDYAGMSLVTPSIRNLIYQPDPSTRLNKDTANGLPPSEAYGYTLYTQHLPSWLNSPGSNQQFAFVSRFGTPSTSGQDVLDNELFEAKERPQTMPASSNLMPFSSSSITNFPSTFDRRMSFPFISHTATGPYLDANTQQLSLFLPSLNTSLATTASATAPPSVFGGSDDGGSLSSRTIPASSWTTGLPYQYKGQGQKKNDLTKNPEKKTKAETSTFCSCPVMHAPKAGEIGGGKYRMCTTRVSAKRAKVQGHTMCSYCIGRDGHVEEYVSDRMAAGNPDKLCLLYVMYRETKDKNSSRPGDNNRWQKFWELHRGEMINEAEAKVLLQKYKVNPVKDGERTDTAGSSAESEFSHDISTVVSPRPSSASAVLNTALNTTTTTTSLSSVIPFRSIHSIDENRFCQQTLVGDNYIGGLVEECNIDVDEPTRVEKTFGGHSLLKGNTGEIERLNRDGRFSLTPDSLYSSGGDDTSSDEGWGDEDSLFEPRYGLTSHL
ncbi:hypothetical protein I352_05776 [Cryptococcus deuterogattii MMRL2647]|nr:hypothetical protein I352_05776 [Cryptococcus deuterogattii MMRL2647]